MACSQAQVQGQARVELGSEEGLSGAIGEGAQPAHSHAVPAVKGVKAGPPNLNLQVKCTRRVSQSSILRHPMRTRHGPRISISR